MRIKLSKDQAYKVNELTKNYQIIAGIDEVGRGPIAGPVVSCALVLENDYQLDEIRDSKKLSDKKRRKLAQILLKDARAVGFGVVEPNIIDDINIRQATHLSMNLAVLNLLDDKSQALKPDLLLIDAEQIESEIDQISITGGDDCVFLISCASILAKVYRDDIMIDYAKKYPEYGFETHKGYGTKKHYQAIDKHGLSPIHRMSFMKKYFEKNGQKINRELG